jgi:hypothetical protein
MPNNLELKDFLPFATSLFGAFFGALGAYFVGRSKEKRDENNRRHTALLATQYALFSQWNIVEDIRKNFLEPFRKDPQKYFKQLEYFRVVGELKVPFEELTFIINSKEPNLLQEIHIAEKRFTSSIELLKKLNQKRIEIQDKYPPKNFDMTIGKGEIDVPRYEIYRLKALTDLLYDEVDKALPDLLNTDQSVFNFIKSNFKARNGAKFVSAETQKIKHP